MSIEIGQELKFKKTYEAQRPIDSEEGCCPSNIWLLNGSVKKIDGDRVIMDVNGFCYSIHSRYIIA